jgi:hypothetical protein
MSDNVSKPANVGRVIDSAEKIAEFVWGDPRMAQRVYERPSGMPVFKCGKRLVARPERLIQWLEDLERRALEKA